MHLIANCVDLIAFKCVSVDKIAPYMQKKNMKLHFPINQLYDRACLRDLLKVLTWINKICKLDVQKVDFFILLFFLKILGYKTIILKISTQIYLIYLSMNFLWNSERRESLIKLPSFSASVLAQFLNTTSSFQRLLTFALPFGADV